MFVRVRMFVGCTRLPCEVGSIHPENPCPCPPTIWWVQASPQFGKSSGLLTFDVRNVLEATWSKWHSGWRCNNMCLATLGSFAASLICWSWDDKGFIGAWMFQTYGWAVNSIQHHPRLFPKPLSLFWWHGKLQSSSPEKWLDLNWRYNKLPLFKATHPLQWSGGLTAGIKAVRSWIKCIGRVSKNRLF